jgi:mitogen-activated protein kinase kinase
VQAAKRTPVDLKEWAVGLLERDNRKSHLAPQLSPATQALLRTNDSPVAGSNSATSPGYSLPTPTSGDIPIGGDDIRSATTSPQYHDPAISSARPSNNGGPTSAARPSGSSFQPGVLPRASTTNSIPKIATSSTSEHAAPNGSSSATAPGFNSTALPMRPAPAGSLPPPPVPRKEVGDDKKEGRRQAAFGNGLYGSGYPSGSH